MVETMGTETREIAMHDSSTHSEVDVLTLVPIVVVEGWVSVCQSSGDGWSGDGGLGDTTTAAKNNIQAKRDLER
jgi:hypothetical protein